MGDQILQNGGPKALKSPCNDWLRKGSKIPKSLKRLKRERSLKKASLSLETKPHTSPPEGAKEKEKTKSKR